MEKEEVEEMVMEEEWIEIKEEEEEVIEGEEIKEWEKDLEAIINKVD